MVRVHFRPLRIKKRPLRPIWRTHVEDEEKLGLAQDDGYDTSSSAHSSRDSSGSYGSHEAMLPSGKRPPPTASAFALQRQLRRRCNRYFTIFIGGILVILVFTLIQLHFNSARKVEEHLHRPEVRPPWEDFPLLSRYYGGLRALVTAEENYPEYPGDEAEVVEEVIEALESARTNQESHTIEKRQERTLARLSISRPIESFRSEGTNETDNKAVECYVDEATKLTTTPIHAYDGVPLGFPDSAIGLGHFDVSRSICLDRFSKLAPYGYGYSRKYGGIGAGLYGDMEGKEEIMSQASRTDYRQVKWAEAQTNCVRKNIHRFRSSDSKNAAAGLSRTAVLVRSQHDHEFSNDDILSLRAIIAEVALETGGLFEVHFLVQVRDDSLQIWSDEDVYRRVLNDSLPQEFNGMGTLWSEKQMSLVYGGVEENSHKGQSVHSSERSMFMPVQLFGHKHPEFDFLWNWDMNVRYTGHIGSLLDESSRWAQQQPRKELWERNERFYVPAEHGSWDDFKHTVRVQSEHKTSESKGRSWSRPGSRPTGTDGLPIVQKPIWGPEKPTWNEVDSLELVAVSGAQEKDKYTWGVSEDADLITFNPIFEPPEIGFTEGSDVTGYNITSGLPPRRATVGTVMRFSKKLLDTMHQETATHRRHMYSSMWPSSVALHYGLKAVYAPHSVYVDRKWPTDYLAAVFNAEGEGGRASVFGESRRHNFRGLTWGADSQFADKLYRRWLGFRVDDEGGEEAELAGEGRMCLPPMLLGPVNRVDLVVE